MGRRRAACLGLLVLVFALMATPATMATPRSPQAQAVIPPTVTAVSPGCNFEEATGSVAPELGSDNKIYGFNSFLIGFDTLNPCDGRLYWFRADPAAHTVEPSVLVTDQDGLPVRGRILAPPAQDGLSTVALISRINEPGNGINEAGVVLVKRFPAGNFRTRKLSSFTIVADLPSGSVDAAFGSCSGWWASWAEQEPGDEFAPSHLYAAHDLQCGADHLIQNRTRMTRPDRSDRQPSIQVVGLGNAANIVWSRDTGPETGELRIAAATPSANWSPSRVITGTNLRHDSPQLRLKDGQRKVAWNRQSRASVGNLPPGVKLSLNFQSGRPTFALALAGSGTIGLLVSTSDAGHLLFSTNRAGSWLEVDLVPVANQSALGVVDTPGPGVAVHGSTLNTNRTYIVFDA
jgi:hypothetical protein